MRKIARTYETMHFPASSHALAIPRFFPLGLPAGGRFLRWCATLAMAIGIASIVFYIFSVNVILLSGKTLRRDIETLKALEGDMSRVREAYANHTAPSWIQERSLANGMVAVTTLRYVSTDPSVALAR